MSKIIEAKLAIRNFGGIWGVQTRIVEEVPFKGRVDRVHTTSFELASATREGVIVRIPALEEAIRNNNPEAVILWGEEKAF